MKKTGKIIFFGTLFGLLCSFGNAQTVQAQDEIAIEDLSLIHIWRLFPRIMQSHFVLWQRPGSIRIWFCHRKRWQRPISIWSHARWWILLKNYKIHTISHECITEYTNAHKCILHWYRTKRLNIFIFNLFSYDKCDEKYIGWWALWLNLEKESLNVGSWFWFWLSCYWFHQQSVT